MFDIIGPDSLRAGNFVTSTVEPLPQLPASTCRTLTTDLRGLPRACLPSGNPSSVHLSWHVLVLVITSNSRSWLAFAADTTLTFDFAPTGIKSAVCIIPLRPKSIHQTPISLALSLGFVIIVPCADLIELTTGPSPTLLASGISRTITTIAIVVAAVPKVLRATGEEDRRSLLDIERSQTRETLLEDWPSLDVQNSRGKTLCLPMASCILERDNKARETKCSTQSRFLPDDDVKATVSPYPYREFFSVSHDIFSISIHWLGFDLSAISSQIPWEETCRYQPYFPRLIPSLSGSLVSRLVSRTI